MSSAVRTCCAIVLFCLNATSGFAVCVPTETWRWDGTIEAPSHPGVCMSPVVVPLTDDNGDGLIDDRDHYDVVFTHEERTGLGDTQLTAVDGDTGAVLFTINTISLYQGAAAADIDGDGIVEILALNSDGGHVEAFEHDGTHKWTSALSPQPLFIIDTVSIADLDQDCSPEIIVGEIVFNADGSLRWAGAGGGGRPIGSGRIAHAADLDPASPGLEVLAGNTLYDKDGAVLWMTSGDDAWTAIADMDGDLEPEIVATDSLGFLTGGVQLYEADGTAVGARYDILSFLPSQPAVADVDGDGQPEVIQPTGTHLEVLEWTGAGFTQKWAQPTSDSTRIAGATAFDLDGDGAAEVAYRDMVNWYLFDGETGAILSQIPFGSITRLEYPVFTDLDGDGSAEILVSGCDLGFGGLDAVIAYTCCDERAPRSIWNQHAYHVTNVADDGTVPTVEAPSWFAGNAWNEQVSAGVGSCATNRAPICDTGGPYLAECNGQPSTLALDGRGSSDPDGDPLEFFWTTTCTGGRYDDPVLDVPTLSLDGPPPCPVACEVTLQVTDPDGLTDRCTAAVTLDDTTVPILAGVPADATVECDAVPVPPPVTATDTCDPAPSVALAEFRIDGGCPGEYSLERTWTATDACSNAAALPQILTVVDTTPPVVAPATDDIACLWPPNHRYVCFDRSAVSPALSDNCSEPVTWAFAGCTSDQPDDAPDLAKPGWNGDGHTADDCVVSIDGDSVCVRAERAGTGPTAQDGRHYGLLIIATDACGNASDPVSIGQIWVPHDMDRAARPRGCLDTTRVGCRPNEAVPCER